MQGVFGLTQPSMLEIVLQVGACMLASMHAGQGSRLSVSCRVSPGVDARFTKSPGRSVPNLLCPTF